MMRVCMIAQYMSWPRLINFMLFNPETAFVSLAVAIQDRRIIRCENGYIGVVQRETRGDDYIVLCKGGEVALIVRRRGLEWELVGDVFVLGMMQGKKWVEEDCEGM